MIRSAGILLGLFLGHAWGGITIPTDNCEWRYNTHGDWNQCFANEVAIGTCGSGEDLNCQNGGASHGIYCCDLPDYLYTEYEVVSAAHGVNADCSAQPICGECGSGENNDCHGYSHQVMCCDATYGGLPIKPGIGASGEENCYWIYEYYWGAELFCNREDEAIFGRCGSGKDHNCDQNTEAFGIKCCEITV